jgi:hypothetical protein
MMFAAAAGLAGVEKRCKDANRRPKESARECAFIYCSRRALPAIIQKNLAFSLWAGFSGARAISLKHGLFQN